MRGGGVRGGVRGVKGGEEGYYMISQPIGPKHTATNCRVEEG